jgi:hypothetical protein
MSFNFARNFHLMFKLEILLHRNDKLVTGHNKFCTPNGHLYRVTYTGCPIDTINSPDDGHVAARNM